MRSDAFMEFDMGEIVAVDTTATKKFIIYIIFIIKNLNFRRNFIMTNEIQVFKFSILRATIKSE